MLIIVTILVHILELIGGVLLLMPGLLVMAAFVPVAGVIAVENVGPIKAMQRSYALTKSRIWPMLGFALGVALVDLLASYALGIIPAVLGAVIGDYGWIVVGILGSAGTIVSLAFVGTSAAMMYLDLRVRTEGLDLQMQLDAWRRGS